VLRVKKQGGSADFEEIIDIKTTTVYCVVKIKAVLRILSLFENTRRLIKKVVIYYIFYIISLRRSRGKSDYISVQSKTFRR